MNKVFDAFAKALSAASAAKKLTSVSVARGKTAFPRNPADMERLGIRCDYDTEITKDGTTYNKFDVQPNAGKVPTAVKKWREDNGGTHADMGVMYVPKDGDVADVEKAFQKFRDDFNN